MTTRCNICGGTEFGAGPGGRLSATGKPPKCEGCFSLERHRALRRLYVALRDRLDLETMSALMISQDGAIEPSWFGEFVVSVYDGPHSIDIQNIDRPDGAYDVVICNHVLEHVADDVRALQELMRIVSPSGFFQLSVPDPVRRERTSDWGYPDHKQHGHYRVYGRDIEAKFEAAFAGSPPVLRVDTIDPVTRMEDVCFFFTRDEHVRSEIEAISTGRWRREFDFGRNGASETVKRGGWYPAERIGSWTKAKGEIELKVPKKGTEPLLLTVKGAPILSPSLTKNEVKVRCNEVPLATWEFPRNGRNDGSSTLAIPGSVWAQRETLKVEFETQAARAPSELAVSEDARVLGFFISSLSVETKTGDPLA